MKLYVNIVHMYIIIIYCIYINEFMNIYMNVMSVCLSVFARFMCVWFCIIHSCILSLSSVKCVQSSGVASNNKIWLVCVWIEMRMLFFCLFTTTTTKIVHNKYPFHNGYNSIVCHTNRICWVYRLLNVSHVLNIFVKRLHTLTYGYDKKLACILLHIQPHMQLLYTAVL